MSWFRLVNILLLFFVIINAKRRHYVEFLTDLITQIEYSNKVVTYLCWEKGDLFALSKTFSRNFISHGFLTSSHSGGDFFNGYKVMVLNLSCKGSVYYLENTHGDNLLDSTITWILFAGLDEVKSYNFYFPVNSLVYIVETEEDFQFSVKIIWKNNKADLRYIDADVAKWKPNKKFLYFKRFSLSINRTDLMGSPIRVSFVLSENDTLNHLRDYRNIHTDKQTKANYVLISHVLDMLNATQVDVWANTWGYRNEVTKTYNGMYGDLIFDRADLAGTGGLMQTARAEYVKFIPPTNPTLVYFMFKSPPLSHTTNIFTRPLKGMVWATFFGLMTLSAVLFYAASIFEWKRSKIKTCKPKISDVVFLECVIVAQRGVTFEPKLLSLMIILVYTSAMTMYVYTGFSAYILVLLQSTSESITDLPSLYNFKMEMGVENTTYNRYYFTTPNGYSNETFRRLILENRIAPKNNWFTAKEGLEKVRRGAFAFHVESGTGFSLIKDTFTDKDMCKIRTTPTIFRSNGLFIAVPRNCVYTEMFLVGRIFETGLQQREHRKFFATKPRCTGRHGNYDSIRLVDCYFPFLIFAFGIVAGTSILFFEKFWTWG